MGTIILKLYEKEAPITVKNFIDLGLGRKTWTDPRTGQPVKRPLYNGTIFHRVIPDFMIQGGDPLGNGTGTTARIKDEIVPALKFDKPGVLAMANLGEPNTGSCQFFITDGPAGHINGQHTIFGQVVEGQDVVAKIARVPKSPRDNSRPATPVKLVSVTFKREGAAPANDPLGAPAKRPAASAAGKAPAKKAAPAKK
jgi:cyclophilin family peptidyl-prolyl cis-trans isomerase